VRSRKGGATGAERGVGRGRLRDSRRSTVDGRGARRAPATAGGCSRCTRSGTQAVKVSRVEMAATTGRRERSARVEAQKESNLRSNSPANFLQRSRSPGTRIRRWPRGWRGLAVRSPAGRSVVSDYRGDEHCRVAAEWLQGDGSKRAVKNMVWLGHSNREQEIQAARCQLSTQRSRRLLSGASGSCSRTLVLGRGPSRCHQNRRCIVGRRRAITPHSSPNRHRISRHYYLTTPAAELNIHCWM
jgi:hypothetical protein